jgi:hypothetical protein
MTQCLIPIILTAAASFSGSLLSGGKGLPDFTAQNLHRRVQMSPRIMKVAVPLFQHSPMFGQLPLLQMV